jgi:hypothetical protein
MFQQRVPKHVEVYVCRVLYYEVHLLDDTLMPLRQHSSGETGENNENRKPISLHDVFSLTATPTCLWFSKGKLKRIFYCNFIDLTNEVSVAIWTGGSPFHLLALSRCCRKANWPLLPSHLRAMAAGAAPCTRAKQNSTEIKINILHLVCYGLRILDHHSVLPRCILLSLSRLICTL